MTAEIPPPQRPHLRSHRLVEVDADVEHWIWEPSDQAWRLASTTPRAELDARAAEWLRP